MIEQIYFDPRYETARAKITKEGPVYLVQYKDEGHIGWPNYFGTYKTRAEAKDALAKHGIPLVTRW